MIDFHQTVLLNESIDALNIQPDGIYVDATFGGGGHSKEILKRLKTGRLIAFDQDEDALKNEINDDRMILLQNNFRYLKKFLRYYDALPVNGIIADLGVSSYQFENAERGFSIRYDAFPDMRMDRRKKLTAAEILNTWEEKQLSDIFYQYGEIENSRRLAQTIVEKRKNETISSLDQFKNLISKCTPRGKENKYLAKVFQALRIEINEELEALKDLLLQANEVLCKNGRLVIISYHSLEDRLVKNFMRSGNFDGTIEKDFFGNVLAPLQPLQTKAIIPDENEIEKNNRARSAKMRIAQKL